MTQNYARNPRNSRQTPAKKPSVSRQKNKYPRWLYAVVALIAASLLLTAALILYSRAMVTDEQRIRNSLAMIELAVETRQTRGVMAQVDADYADEFGQNYDRLHERVRGWTALNLTRKVEIDFTNIGITIAPDKQRAEVLLTVSGNEPIQQVLGYLRTRDNRVTVTYAKKRDWRVVGCRAETR